MSKSYAQLMKQIAKLQSEAENIRRQEAQGVIDRIKDAIDAYGLTAADLGLAASRKASSAKAAVPGRKRRKPGRPKAKAAPKFRDEAGNTWVGRGKRPDWLRNALASGRSLEDFLIR